VQVCENKLLAQKRNKIIGTKKRIKQLALVLTKQARK